MSTVYYLVNPEREKAFSDFEKTVLAIKDEAAEKISKIAVPDFLEDAKDELLDSVNRRTLAGFLDGTEYDKSIATHSVNGFRWHSENGFRSIEYVEAFLTENPGYEVQDEYSKPVSLAELKKLCR